MLLPGLPFALRDKKMRLLVVTLTIGVLGVFAVVWSFPHYAAPFLCVVVALLVQSMRHSPPCSRGMAAGPLAGRAPPFCCS